MQPRFAIVVSVCAGKDWYGEGEDIQLRRAERFVKVVKKLQEEWRGLGLGGTTPPPAGSPLVDFVLLASTGIPASQLDPLRLVFDRVLLVEKKDLEFKVRAKNDGLWPLANELQDRKDGWCTLLRFHAWRLVEYDAVFSSDVDLCPYTDPVPYLKRFFFSERILLALPERAARGHWGLRGGYLMLRPSLTVARILLDKARFGDFVSFVNGDQDVLETAMNLHASFAFPPSKASKKDMFRYFGDDTLLSTIGVVGEDLGFRGNGWAEGSTSLENPEIRVAGEHVLKTSWTFSSLDNPEILIERLSDPAKPKTWFNATQMDTWSFLGRRYLLPPFLHFKGDCCTISPEWAVRKWYADPWTEKVGAAEGLSVREEGPSEGGRKVERICVE